MKILFLATRMCNGYGVSVVVDELAVRLKSLGVKAIIGCLESDNSFMRSDVRIIEPTTEALRTFIRDHGVELVIAHTSPYFELLHTLREDAYVWAWEHGEPSPSFFPDAFFEDGESSRQRRAEHKLTNIYPKLDAVIAISEFVRNDIGWLSAPVIYNGCDHVTDLSIKPRPFFNDARPLRVGTLLRLGQGEAAYKGIQQFIEVVAYFKKKNSLVTFEIMGRGRPEDGLEFARHGIKTHLNGTDEERSAFLRGLDLFISCSLWEGFNLPLVEAQASGTAALALDVGAHPEVTPYICKNLTDLCDRIEGYDRDRHLLYLHSKESYRFVRARFLWDQRAMELFRLMIALYGSGRSGRLAKSRFTHLALKAFDYIGRIGVKGTFKKAIQFVSFKLSKKMGQPS